MNRDDIIRMAREAGWPASVLHPHGPGVDTSEHLLVPTLERFAALVAAAERERIIAKNAPEIERCNAHIKALEDAVAAEREKSLRLWMLLDDIDTADDIAKGNDKLYRMLCQQSQQKRWEVLSGEEIDAALRARGEK